MNMRLWSLWCSVSHTLPLRDTGWVGPPHLEKPEDARISCVFDLSKGRGRAGAFNCWPIWSLYPLHVGHHFGVDSRRSGAATWDVAPGRDSLKHTITDQWGP